MPKSKIRTQMLHQRRSLSETDCRNASLAIQQNFLALPEYQQAGVVALYSPVHNEVLTREVFRAARAVGKIVVFPRVCGEVLEFFAVSAECDLSPSRLGIAEPVVGQKVATTDLDLVVVPGVAFDRSGNRLGYGRGYYDRAFAGRSTKCLLVGFAYAFQLHDRLPVHDHDVVLDLLLTEQHLLYFHHPASEDAVISAC